MSPSPSLPRAPLTTPVRLLVVVLMTVAAALVPGLVAAPAQAQVSPLVVITAKGVSPKVLTIELGQTVTFVNDDETFLYRAVNTSDNWQIDSGIQLAPGGRYPVPKAELGESGTYSYEVAQDAPFAGTIKVVAPGQPDAASGGSQSPKASAKPSSRPSAKPGAAAPSGSAAPTARPSGSPAATGGSGVAIPPGFNSLGVVPGSPAPEGFAPPPALADLLAIDGEAVPPPATAGSPLPEVSGSPFAVLSEGFTGAPVRGAVPSQGGNSLGLPALLAAVLMVGIVSLLVRLLLAEPAARRPVLVRPVVSTD